MSEDERLRRTLHAAREAFDLMDDGIVFADTDDRLLLANTATARLAELPVPPTRGDDAQALLDAAVANGIEVNRVPRYDEDGTLWGWTAVLREPRVHRLMNGRAPEGGREHSEVLDLVAGIAPGESLEDTAHQICDAVAALPGFDGAMIMLLPSSGDLTYISHAGNARVPYKSGQRIPLKDLEAMIDLTVKGPWAVSSMSGAAFRLFGPWALPLRVAGIRATAYAPMLVGGRLLGVLSVASQAADGMRVLERRLDTLAQLAGVAGTIIGNQAADFGRLEATRKAVHECLQHERFHPVFQPIVHLVDGSVHAYEALTRFDDGVPPDTHFLEAHHVGLGAELELAAMRLAVRAAATLPPGTPLAVNLSPDVLATIAGTDLLHGYDRSIIIEVTEHAPIEDYERLLQSLDSAPHMRLSVDDAGAGFASLRHILELQPEYVKLDMAIVRDVDKDPARAALVAGMCHFARATNKVLIAEGVETEGEALALRQLGVDLAQGYHFGRPAPADTFHA